MESVNKLCWEAHKLVTFTWLNPLKHHGDVVTRLRLPTRCLQATHVSLGFQFLFIQIEEFNQLVLIPPTVK